MKKIKFLITLSLGILIMQGCAELDLNSPSSPSDASFFSTEDQLEVALVGVYEEINFVRVTPFPILLEQTTDLAYNRGNTGGTTPAATGAMTSTDDLTNATWDQFYRTIQRANNLLQNMERAVDNANPDRFEEIRAEALFLRALAYSYLTELYGDVPFRTSVSTNLDELIEPRTSKATIVDAMIADLEIAASILPAKNERGRASGNAANTLIARYALYNEDWARAETAAEAVISDGSHELYSDYESLFQDPGVGSDEVIFEFNYAEGVKTWSVRQLGTRFGGWCQLVPAQQTVDTYETVNGLPIDEDPAFDPTNPFEDRDPRLKATIAVPGEVWCSHIIQTHSDSIRTWRVDDAGNPVERVFNRNAASTAPRDVVDPFDGMTYTTDGNNRFTSFTGYVWKKFVEQDRLFGDGGSVGSADFPFYVMRYAEVLLIYAEAKIESGTIDQSVLDAINDVRARAYGTNRGDIGNYPAITTMVQAELRKIIRRERKSELAQEGLRLFDIRRWRIAEKVMNTTLFGSPSNGFSKIGGILGFVPDIDDDGFVYYTGAPSQPRMELGNLDYRELEARSFNPSRDYLWAIPQSEIDASNGEVTQNPGGY